jgi:hypothetical protein
MNSCSNRLNQNLIGRTSSRDFFFTCRRVWSLFEEGELNDMAAGIFFYLQQKGMEFI